MVLPLKVSLKEKELKKKKQMNKTSYLTMMLIMMSVSFSVGVVYSDKIKSNMSWVFDDKESKYKEEYVNKTSL
jgi:hypothetical protein